MKRTNIIHIAITFMLCIMSCTTEVDIVTGNSFQNLAEVELSYDLSNLSGIEQEEMPDSLIVVAYRIINSWKSTYMAPFKDDPNNGRYIFNKPYDTAESDGINRGGESIHAPEEFLLKTGEYRFIAMNNIITNNITYTEYSNNHWFKTENLIDSAITNKEIMLYYSNYSINNEFVNKYGNAWSDFNPYSTYISNSCSPILFCYSDVHTLDNKAKNYVNLVFEKISQDIEIRFSVRHESVVLEKIIAEISGIPCGINLLTKKLDLSKTYKTIFELEEIHTEKGADSDFTEFAGNINVIGLVSNNDKEAESGPGIMQLAIYTHSINERGEKKSKIFHMGINLYNIINKYSHIISGYNEKILLDIKDEIIIKKDEVLTNPNSDNSIGKWINYDDNIHLDV
ncbi:MAG: hypothetical protein J6Q48_02170 [Bacteroidaceae bacterium]|nr:hypothetical protein [Bacteroidaceae bacterium]